MVRKASEDDLIKRASLLRRDSVHGSFQGTIRVDEENECIIANGNVIRVIYAPSPDQVDYESYGIHNALIIDNTGAWRDMDGLSEHLKSKGAGKVVLTAPGKGGVKNIISGINTGDIEESDRVLAAGSCTTNAIVPVLKAMNDHYGIECGHMETVHAYTNDQNLIDNYHKKNRRGRGAPLNMVITETGASSAVVKLLPELEGKLTGNAIRVPTPNVSLVILNLTWNKQARKMKYVSSCAQRRYTAACSVKLISPRRPKLCPQTWSATATHASSMVRRLSPRTIVWCCMSGTTTNLVMHARWFAWRKSYRVFGIR